MKAFIVSSILLLSGMSAFATQETSGVLQCHVPNVDETIALKLSRTRHVEEERVISYALELYHGGQPEAQAYLRIPAEQVHEGASIVAVDAFESMVGDLQLVSIFRVGSSTTQNTSFLASYGRDKNNGGSFGLHSLQALSAANHTWFCKRL